MDVPATAARLEIAARFWKWLIVKFAKTPRCISQKRQAEACRFVEYRGVEPLTSRLRT